jgi:hypothetical protein
VTDPTPKEVAVSLNRFHLTILTAWFMTLVVALAIRTAAGLPLSFAGAVGAMALGCVPAVVLLMVFRGAPPQTIAEFLRETEPPARYRAALTPRLERT